MPNHEGAVRRLLPAVAGAVLLLAGHSARAQDCPNPKVPCIVEPRFDLKITALTPASGLIEHQPIAISFTLAPLARGPRWPRVAGAVCVLSDLSAPCLPIEMRGPADERRGTLHAKAPAAGAAAVVEIAFCRDVPGEHPGCVSAGHDFRELPVAARYEVILQSFEILHTKAQINDTVHAVLLGQASDTPPARDSGLCDIVGPPTFCTRLLPQGDRQDGVHAFLGDLRVGPFDLVPEADPNLSVWYILVNAGFQDSYGPQYVKFMNILNSMAGGAFGAVLQSEGGSGSAAGTLSDATRQLNETIASDCDGVVVDDMRTVLNRTVNGQWQSTLDARTRDRGFWVGGLEDGDVFVTPNKAECGHSARYKVAWRVARVSWEPAPGVAPPLDCFALPPVSDEGGPSYCPAGSAAAGLSCSGRSCDWVSLNCCRYGWEAPRGHRDAGGPHAWTEWFSEEEGLPPGTSLSSHPATFVTGIQCRGDFCDDLRLDGDAAVQPGEGCSWIPEGTCPANQLMVNVRCTSGYCSDLMIQCCPIR